MITTNMPNIPYDDLPQNVENLILSINNSTSHVLSNTNNNLEKKLTSAIETIKLSQNTAENVEINSVSFKLRIPKKYNITGNLYLSSLDLWNLLNNHYKNYSKNKFDNNFDFGFNIFDEFLSDISHNIMDKFGNFKINLRKKWNT